MKKITILAIFLFVTSLSYAKIYKWVDENGSIHFSDTPYSEEAKEVKVQGTGISVEKTEEQRQAQESKAKEQARQEQDKKTKEKPTTDKKSAEADKIITEDDYRISSSVGKVGADIISISGRISSGPRCKDMTVTATATNDNGLSGTITDNVSKTNSYGSTTFEGNAKVSGSAEDYGFWEVASVTIRCNDER